MFVCKVASVCLVDDFMMQGMSIRGTWKVVALSSFKKSKAGYTTYRILNYITRTMPLGAKCYDYSMASQKTKTTYI